MSSPRGALSMGVSILLVAVFVWFMVPETKGKTLEEIELWWLPKR